ncbi:hypothetical protein AAC387_Pa11g1061 [Persea americana]
MTRRSLCRDTSPTQPQTQSSQRPSLRGWVGEVSLQRDRRVVAAERSSLDRDRHIVAAERSSKKKMGSRNGEGFGNGGRARGASLWRGSIARG